jgi:hypothetical protein
MNKSVKGLKIELLGDKKKKIATKTRRHQGSPGNLNLDDFVNLGVLVPWWQKDSQLKLLPFPLF